MDREPKTKKEYQNHLDRLARLGLTPEQYILAKYFVKKDNRQHTIVKNEYPYILPIGARHYLLWTIIDMDIHDATKLAFKYFDRLNYKVQIIFENDTKNKSVKGLKHFHIIVEPNEKNTLDKIKKLFYNSVVKKVKVLNMLRRVRILKD